MITLKDITDYNFDSIEEYFNYILESKINGNYSQVSNLIKKLSLNQKKTLLQYLVVEYMESEHTKYVFNTTIDLL